MNKKAIFEDVEMQYNRWVQGIASREQAAGKITLHDLFNRQNNQFPNAAQERAYVPPSMTSISTIIGNIIINNSNLQDKIKITWGLPFCKEHKDHRDIVKAVYSKSKKIDQIMQQIIRDMDLLVEKPKTTDKLKKNETNH